MYRLARNNMGLVTNHPWDWYLNNAYQTAIAMMKQTPGYAQFGQMEGDVFVQILLDLNREGWTEQAADLTARMKSRADRWKSQAYPFGSEMPWDSTGQEEVYAWTKYFGYAAKSEVTLDAGRFSSVSVNPKTGAVRLGLDAAKKFTPKARLRVEQPAKLGSTGTYHPVAKLESERGAYVVPLRAGTTWVELQP